MKGTKTGDYVSLTIGDEDYELYWNLKMGRKTYFFDLIQRKTFCRSHPWLSTGEKTFSLNRIFGTEVTRWEVIQDIGTKESMENW